MTPLLQYLQVTWQRTLEGPSWKWFGAWLVSVLEASVGPLDRGLVQVLFTLFLLDTVLGTLHGALNRRFRCQRLFFACVKGAVYFCLLSAAWMFRRSDALGFLPVGMVLGTALEGFLVITEGVSVLRNADHVLRRLGVRRPALSRLSDWLEEQESAPAPADEEAP